MILNAAIGCWQEAKAVEAVNALRRLSATHAIVLRDGHVARVPTIDLVVGDMIALTEGDAVGADCRLASASSPHIAEASLTGEGTPVVKGTSMVDTDSPLADRTNMASSGAAVVRGRGEDVVVATGMGTEIGRIATLIDEQEDTATPLQQQVAWLGRQPAAGPGSEISPPVDRAPWHNTTPRRHRECGDGNHEMDRTDGRAGSRRDGVWRRRRGPRRRRRWGSR